MGTVDRLNEFINKHGGSKLDMDEDLMLQYEDKSERVYYASVYGSNFRKVPLRVFTSQNAYREWCIAVAGIKPPKRSGESFDKYTSLKLLEAVLRDTLPGNEEDAAVGKWLMRILKNSAPVCVDYDDANRPRGVLEGDLMFFATRPEGNGKECFVRVEATFDRIVKANQIGLTERKIERGEVCEWLEAHARTHYDRFASPRRLRSTYALPYSLVMNFKVPKTLDGLMPGVSTRWGAALPDTGDTVDEEDE